jgi:uncharacterized membrane protein
MSSVLPRNIEALAAQRQAEDQRLGWQERLAAAITRFTGSIAFVYLHTVLYGLWILVNVGWVPLVPRFDPTFVILAMAASVEAIFLSTFILITQNRMLQAARRADLDLQISLLAEHEVTRLITIVKEIGQRMGIEAADAGDLEEFSRDVRPEEVLQTIDEREQADSKPGARAPRRRGGNG